MQRRVGREEKRLKSNRIQSEHDRRLVTTEMRRAHAFPMAPLQVFVTASTDSSIHLWDVRTLGSKMKPLATAQHSQTCQAAFFAPDGASLIVASLWALWPAFPVVARSSLPAATAAGCVHMPMLPFCRLPPGGKHLL